MIMKETQCPYCSTKNDVIFVPTMLRESDSYKVDLECKQCKMMFFVEFTLTITPSQHQIETYGLDRKL